MGEPGPSVKASRTSHRARSGTPRATATRPTSEVSEPIPTPPNGWSRAWRSAESTSARTAAKRGPSGARESTTTSTTYSCSTARSTSPRPAAACIGRATPAGRGPDSMGTSPTATFGRRSRSREPSTRPRRATRRRRGVASAGRTGHCSNRQRRRRHARRGGLPRRTRGVRARVGRMGRSGRRRHDRGTGAGPRVGWMDDPRSRSGGRPIAHDRLTGR